MCQLDKNTSFSNGSSAREICFCLSALNDSLRLNNFISKPIATSVDAMQISLLDLEV